MNNTLATGNSHHKAKTTTIADESMNQCASTAKQLPQRIKVVLMGDSITQMSFSAELSGWGAHLAYFYQRRADIYNRGFSGYNTDWFLKYLETDQGRRDLFFRNPVDDTELAEGSSTQIRPEFDIGKNNVKLVTIFFGANDASDAILNPRHHVPLSRFRTNLRKIASLCRQNYGMDVHIIFITPPPVHNASRLIFQVQKFGKEKATGKLERSLELSGMYASAVETVANELGVPCLNIWEKMQEAKAKPSDNNEEESPWKVYLSDGLHLSREGNIFVGRYLVEMIRQQFPDIAVLVNQSDGYVGGSDSTGGNGLGGSGGVGPWHNEIDYRNPDLAFKI